MKNNSLLIVVVVVGVLTVGAAFVFRGSSNNAPAKDLPYVNPAIAMSYQEFNQSLDVNEPAALAALDAADKASPENAFNDDLRAVVSVRKKDYAGRPTI